jgi:endonuclease III
MGDIQPVGSGILISGNGLEMANSSPSTIVENILKEYGQTFSQELGIPIEKNNPATLFRLLCATLLFSTRIQEKIAVKAAKALNQQGWNTPQKMLDASWEERARCLNEAGYARYDERTAAMLGDSSQFLVEHYDGDLRQLRKAAEHNPDQEHKLLQEFKGIGKVGANIFLREVQVAWNEVFPFADDRILETARAVNLPGDVEALQDLVSREDFPRLVAALVRVRLAHDEDKILEKAHQE